MNVSSRTPEGVPHRCAMCGKAARLDRSEPLGDTVCPSCGSLIQAHPLRSQDLAVTGKEMPITRLIPEESGEPILLVRPRMLLGRRASCDIHLTATNISAHHCEFEYIDGQLTVRDLQSTNGTKVNGNRITSCVIHSGDQVSAAKTKFLVEIEPQPK